MNGAKVFVKIDDYKDIIDIVELLKEKIEEARSILESLSALKSQEDAELDAWRNTLDAIQSKSDYVDKALFQENI